MFKTKPKMKTKAFFKNRMNLYFKFAKSQGNNCIAKPKREILLYVNHLYIAKTEGDQGQIPEEHHMQ